jgi:hypothetical protein
MKLMIVGLMAAAATLSACAETDAAGFRSSAPQQPAVPEEFEPACGKPGSKVEVRAETVTVPRRDCDLRGVTLTHKGAGAVVPDAPGDSVSIFQDAPVGEQTQSASVSVDKATGDVTFQYTAT